MLANVEIYSLSVPSDSERFDVNSGSQIQEAAFSAGTLRHTILSIYNNNRS